MRMFVCLCVRALYVLFVVSTCYCLQEKSKFVEIKEECRAEDEQGVRFLIVSMLDIPQCVLSHGHMASRVCLNTELE